jgi:hypothetical protein
VVSGSECDMTAPSAGRMMEGPGGAPLFDLRVRDGCRQSVFRSYDFRYIDPPNLTVLTGARRPGRPGRAHLQARGLPLKKAGSHDPWLDQSGADVERLDLCGQRSRIPVLFEHGVGCRSADSPPAAGTRG